MAEGQTKSKIVSFRLSSEEYQAVDDVTQKHGFASVSLFARSATLKCDTDEPVKTPLDMEINRLLRRIEVLISAVEKITTQLGVLFKTNWH
jgi:Mobilization protein NikA